MQGAKQGSKQKAIQWQCVGQVMRRKGTSWGMEFFLFDGRSIYPGFIPVFHNPFSFPFSHFRNSFPVAAVLHFRV